jgi:hypothetical protein
MRTIHGQLGLAAVRLHEALDGRSVVIRQNGVLVAGFLFEQPQQLARLAPDVDDLEPQGLAPVLGDVDAELPQELDVLVGLALRRRELADGQMLMQALLVVRPVAFIVQPDDVM